MILTACTPGALSMIDDKHFSDAFLRLTGHRPFSWQRRLFREWFARGCIPSGCDIPTGLGKTSVMAIWYLALRVGALVPRRLVYVVDRRAVVDQATTIADEIKEKSDDSTLGVSTLRGQHVDNRAWLADPAAPAIIVGTIDMIGSRLLFSGYGVSRRMRPYHAGLLGADTIVVLDESHLVPPFERSLVWPADEHKLGLGPAFLSLFVYIYLRIICQISHEIHCIYHMIDFLSPSSPSSTFSAMKSRADGLLALSRWRFRVIKPPSIALEILP